MHLVVNEETQFPTTHPGTIDRSYIQVKSLAVVLDQARARHLVFKARSQAGTEFNRPLGGSVELGERSLDAVVREIREELDATFVPEGLLGIVENIFELDGELGHDIVFSISDRSPSATSYPMKVARSTTSARRGGPSGARSPTHCHMWRSFRTNSRTYSTTGSAADPDRSECPRDWLHGRRYSRRRKADSGRRRGSRRSAASVTYTPSSLTMTGFRSSSMIST